jgi:phytoene dehydrogenase-like protein
MRPLPGWADYRTPIGGLYLCGPGTHPGAGVAGASGLNCARVVLGKLRQRGA